MCICLPPLWAGRSLDPECGLGTQLSPKCGPGAQLALWLLQLALYTHDTGVGFLDLVGNWLRKNILFLFLSLSLFLHIYIYIYIYMKWTWIYYVRS